MSDSSAAESRPLFSWPLRLALVALLLNAGNPFLVAIAVTLYALQVSFHRGVFVASSRAKAGNFTLA
jgi:hypothetical protein